MHNPPLAVVVEDDHFLSEIYSDALRSSGLRVETFYEGQSAIKAIKELIPNLIVLDLNLPNYSGLEIFRDLRNNPATAETWVLIVTADPSQAAELSRSEIESQNLLVLSKPISVDQLDQLAKRLVFQK